MGVTMIRTRWLLAYLPGLVFACASPRFSSGEPADAQFISEDEVDASQGVTAYEVIQRLRPNFLTYRGETSLERKKSQPYPSVFVDGMEFGSVGTLRNIPALQISTIRLYRSWDAATTFGTGKMAGVIAITTRH